MSTSSSNLVKLKELARTILSEQEEIAHSFSQFQNKVNLPCPPGCGRCCFKPDIYCTPIELLPMALDMLERGIAEEFYDKCLENLDERCLFIQIQDRASGKGYCSEYKFRPLVCRSFGIAGTHDKEGKTKFSICSLLKEENPDALEKVESHIDGSIPYVDFAKNKLAALDPRLLEQEFPINVSLKIMLEKVLVLTSYEERG